MLYSKNSEFLIYANFKYLEVWWKIQDGMRNVKKNNLIVLQIYETTSLNGVEKMLLT